MELYEGSFTRVVYIYALCCPDFGDVRYIGKTIDPDYRLMRHCCAYDLKISNSNKSRWIKKLIKNGKKPRMKILSCVPESDADRHEIEWIARGRSKGWILLNGTMGGDGIIKPPGSSMPIAHRLAIGRGNKGKKYSPEILKKLGDIRRAFQARQTPEQKRAWGLARAHVYSEEEKARKSKAQIGFKSKTASSKYIGVRRYPNGTWIVDVIRKKKHYYLGYFRDEIEAAKAYDKWALGHDGADAKTNFPIAKQ